MTTRASMTEKNTVHRSGVTSCLLRWSLSLCVSGFVVLSGMSAFAADPENVGNIPVKDAIEVAKKLSPDELRSNARNYIKGMQGVLSSTTMVREQTKDDILKLNCINAKLAAIKGFLKVSESSKVKLDEALIQNASETAGHQYALIVIANSKVSNLGVEAQSCAGEALSYLGNTAVTADIDTDIAEIDATELLSELETLYQLYEATPFIP